MTNTEIIETLSYSEQKAMKELFNEITGSETIIVAGKIADKIGISRAVFINAFRKLEIAGLIKTRSLGIKGTWIKVNNQQFLDELKAA